MKQEEDGGEGGDAGSLTLTVMLVDLSCPRRVLRVVSVREGHVQSSVPHRSAVRRGTDVCWGEDGWADRQRFAADSPRNHSEDLQPDIRLDGYLSHSDETAAL